MVGIYIKWVSFSGVEDHSNPKSELAIYYWKRITDWFKLPSYTFM